MAHHPRARPSKTSEASWDGKVTHRRHPGAAYPALTAITEEPLDVRLAALLSNHGHVPQSKQGVCLRDLREVVRERIKGAHDGRWSKADLLAELIRHGGSLARWRRTATFTSGRDPSARSSNSSKKTMPSSSPSLRIRHVRAAHPPRLFAALAAGLIVYGSLIPISILRGGWSKRAKG
ncbi:hypothetical protein [Bradyrhizobium sp. 179]|uniref:hypothetical protein n=1 Tax=Bradyrhizobium sp. 179 TaxID=2782648 RepID=UPI001FFB1BF5|nr:hypothetical protein [Bradyrhizobium sp. 179]